jgi:hypothetical protein
MDRRPVWLGPELLQSIVVVQLALIRTVELGRGIDLPIPVNRQKCVAPEKVIMINEGNVVPASGGKRDICGTGNPEIGRVESETHARIGGSQFAQGSDCWRMNRSVVDDEPLPIGVSLIPQHLEQLPQKARVGVEGRREHGDAKCRVGRGRSTFVQVWVAELPHLQGGALPYLGTGQAPSARP